MSEPKRIQRRRMAGWKMPAGAVYVGRPTKWGNPFAVDGDWITWAAVGLGYRGDATGRRAAAVALFSSWVTGAPVEPGPNANTHDGGEVEFSDGSCASMAEHARNVALVATSVFPAPRLSSPPSPYLLRGKDLACWCPLDAPCHADVLLRIANAQDATA